MDSQYYIPTKAEFFDFVNEKGWQKWGEELYDEMKRTHWLRNGGKLPKNWKTITASRSDVIRRRHGYTKDIRSKVVINEFEEDFPDNGLHYVCYTDGSCDNCSQTKAGGSAYIILKDGEITKIKNHGQLNTSNNRMELLAIISAVNSCPSGAYVDVYTDSQYCILVLSKDFKPKKNPDLYELYKKCAAHLAGVRFHWVKGHDGNKYNEMADELAYSAYCEICDQYNIEKSRRH